MLRAEARISTSAIERNCARLRSVSGADLCAVVKADGYGHGAVTVARAAQAGGASSLAVATADEALSLRRAGVEGPLLVMGALSDAELPVALEARTEVVAWRLAFLDRLPDGTRVHVKLDTGMGRLGSRDPAEVLDVARAAEERGALAGAMTHFATADDDLDFAREQLGQFLTFAGALPGEPVLHAANSAAALGLPAACLDMVRCGVAIYGLDPFQSDPFSQGLEPALRLTSYVAEVKAIAPGESAGYGRRYVAATEGWIATVPVGYGDGVRRGLTNNADVLIGGVRRPLVGTVSMDNVTVGLDGPVETGAEVVLIGAQGGERILAEEWAERLQTINYEVTCGLSARVPRR